MLQSPYFTGTLYARMAEDLHLGGMSERTHAGYLRAVRKLADYCQTSPDKITEDQLRRFFLHMKNELHYAHGTLRVAFSGIKFFYTRTCRCEWQTLRQMKLQHVQSLPEVITGKQVLQIVLAANTQRMAVYFWTVYSLGLRMQEGHPEVSGTQQSADDHDRLAPDRLGRSRFAARDRATAADPAAEVEPRLSGRSSCPRSRRPSGNTHRRT